MFRKSGKSEPEPMPVRKKTGKRLLCSAVLVPASLLLLAAFLILGLPRRWQVPPLTRMEAFNLQLVIGKTASAMLTKDGKLAEEAELELTQPEINTLLNNGLRAAQLRQTPELFYAAEWKNDALQLRISRIFGFLAVNLEAVLVPAVRGGKVLVRTRSCRIGWIPLPPSLVNDEIQRQIRQYEEMPEFQVIPEIVREMTVHENGVRIRLRPQKISLIFPLLPGVPVPRINEAGK